MPYLKIHDGFENPNNILESLKDDGLVGVSGGRIEVRKKLQEVMVLVKAEGLKGYYIQSTINHPDTELGYGYNENQYTIQQARKFVMQFYDKKYV